MQSAYRTESSKLPLVTWCGGTLLAVDPMRGALLWERKLDRRVARLLVTEHVVVFATGGSSVGSASAIHVLELQTGADRGQFDAGFEVNAATRDGNLLFFGGADGVMALGTNGAIVWRATLEAVKQSAWSGATYDLVARDAAGAELWRLPERTPHGGALAIGDLVAQPDIDT